MKMPIFSWSTPHTLRILEFILDIKHLITDVLGVEWSWRIPSLVFSHQDLDFFCRGLVSEQQPRMVPLNGFLIKSLETSQQQLRYKSNPGRARSHNAAACGCACMTPGVLHQRLAAKKWRPSIQQWHCSFSYGNYQFSEVHRLWTNLCGLDVIICVTLVVSYVGVVNRHTMSYQYLVGGLIDLFDVL